MAIGQVQAIIDTLAFNKRGFYMARVKVSYTDFDTGERHNIATYVNITDAIVKGLKWEKLKR